MVNNKRHRNRAAKVKGAAPVVIHRKRLHLFYDLEARRSWEHWFMERIAAYKAHQEATKDPRGKKMYKRVGPWRMMIESSDIVRLFKITDRAAQYRLQRVREELDKNDREPVMLDEYCEIFVKDAAYIRSVLNKWDEEKWQRLEASSERGYSKPLKRKKKKPKKKKKPQNKKPAPPGKNDPRIQALLDMADDDLPDNDNDDDDDEDNEEPLWHEHRI